LKTFVEAMIRTWHYWYKRNHIREGLQLIDRALRLFGEEVSVDKGRLQSLAGALATKSGDYTRASRYLEQALETGRATENVLLQSIALSNIGNLKWSICQFEEAVEYYEESTARISDQTTKANKLAAYQSWATVLIDAGRVAEAKAAYSLALDLEPNPDDKYVLWMRATIEGQFLFHEAKFEEAIKSFKFAVQCSMELGDLASVARCLYWIAECRYLLGDVATATCLLGAVGASASESGIQLYPINELRLAALEGRCRRSLSSEEFTELILKGSLCPPIELLELTHIQ
jgi:tetratricopeptide (TPR) repeat protein